MTDIREAFRQLLEGKDFTPPTSLLMRITSETACAKLPNLPYSIATNVAHADIWNRVWLARLTNSPRVNPYPDFPRVTSDQWSDVRSGFLKNLQAGLQIAQAEPFLHHCKNDEAARELLLQMVVHSSYHVGQIALLKRANRLNRIGRLDQSSSSSSS